MKQIKPQKTETKGEKKEKRQKDRNLKKPQKDTRKLEGALGLQSQSLRLRKKR